MIDPDNNARPPAETDVLAGLHAMTEVMKRHAHEDRPPTMMVSARLYDAAAKSDDAQLRRMVAEGRVVRAPSPWDVMGWREKTAWCLQRAWWQCVGRWFE